MLEAAADKTPHRPAQRKIVFGRRALPWADCELRLLAQLAPQRCKETMLKRMFPDRSIGVIKNKLAEVRANLGREQRERDSIISPTVLSRDDPGEADGYETEWRRKCLRANERFLAALARAA